MRISGNEHSSVIFSKTKWCQNLRMMEVPKQAEHKGDGVIFTSAQYFPY